MTNINITMTKINITMIIIKINTISSDVHHFTVKVCCIACQFIFFKGEPPLVIYFISIYDDLIFDLLPENIGAAPCKRK